MVKLSLDLDLDPDDLQATMLSLYRQGRLSLLWEYGRALSLAYGGATADAEFARFETVLLTDRNRAWLVELLANAGMVASKWWNRSWDGSCRQRTRALSATSFCNARLRFLWP